MKSSKSKKTIDAQTKVKLKIPQLTLAKIAQIGINVPKLFFMALNILNLNKSVIKYIQICDNFIEKSFL